jgi:hypothetical protein
MQLKPPFPKNYPCSPTAATFDSASKANGCVEYRYDSRELPREFRHIIIHFHMNILAKVSREKMAEVAPMLNAIHAQEDREAAMVEKGRQREGKTVGHATGCGVLNIGDRFGGIAELHFIPYGA